MKGNGELGSKVEEMLIEKVFWSGSGAGNYCLVEEWLSEKLL